MIFHSYVSLPEGMWVTKQMFTTDVLKSEYLMSHTGSWTNGCSVIDQAVMLVGCYGDRCPLFRCT